MHIRFFKIHLEVYFVTGRMTVELQHVRQKAFKENIFHFSRKYISVIL